MKTPRVSVVMPIYRVARYIDAAVASVLAQTLGDFELIGVDDASPDDSADRFLRHRDRRMTLVRHPVNRGLAAARNSGIDAARGEYIALLDSDDVAVRDRLARQVAFLDAHGDIDLCGGSMQPIDAEGRPAGTLQRAETRAERINAALLFRNPFFVSSVTMRRALAVRVRFSESRPMAEDYDFYARAMHEHRLANLDALLLQYRVNPAGLTATRPQLMTDCVESIQRMLLLHLGLRPAPRELAVHRHLGDLHLSNDEGVLQEAADWLSRLRAARPPGIRPDAWLAQLADCWFEACSHASGIGHNAWARFVSSELRSRVTVPRVRIAKFAIKATFGWSRGRGPLRLAR